MSRPIPSPKPFAPSASIPFRQSLILIFVSLFRPCFFSNFFSNLLPAPRQPRGSPGRQARASNLGKNHGLPSIQACRRAAAEGPIAARSWAGGDVARSQPSEARSPEAARRPDPNQRRPGPNQTQPEPHRKQRGLRRSSPGRAGETGHGAEKERKARLTRRRPRGGKQRAAERRTKKRSGAK